MRGPATARRAAHHGAEPTLVRRATRPARSRVFTAQGFDVIAHGPCGLPSNQRSINPPELYDWIRTDSPTDAEAVFVGGNGFRAVGVIDALEQDLGIPVLTANQVLLWKMLERSGTALRPHGYGKLFDPPGSSPASSP